MIINIFNTDKKYKVILADPPWTFKTYSDKGKGRSAEQHYNCMSIDDVKKLPVSNIRDNKECVLFLWVTDPMLNKGLEVMKSWGFTYKTICFTWAKINKTAKLNCLSEKDFFMGMGYYSRKNPEICLLGTYNKSPSRVNFGVRQLIIDYRREHSRKPDCVNNRIDTLFGDIPRIELFSRQEKPGWDSWGNEVSKFNENV